VIIIPTRLKLLTSNLAGMFFGTFHTTLKNLSNRGRGQDQGTPINFWALNANCYNMVKDTDFKFEEHIPWDSPDMSPKNLSKIGVAMVTWPLKF